MNIGFKLLEHVKKYCIAVQGVFQSLSSIIIKISTGCSYSRMELSLFCYAVIICGWPGDTADNIEENDCCIKVLWVATRQFTAKVFKVKRKRVWKLICKKLVRR